MYFWITCLLEKRTLIGEEKLPVGQPLDSIDCGLGEMFPIYAFLQVKQRVI